MAASQCISGSVRSRSEAAGRGHDHVGVGGHEFFPVIASGHVDAAGERNSSGVQLPAAMSGSSHSSSHAAAARAAPPARWMRVCNSATSASPRSAMASAPATRRTSSQISASESGCSDTTRGWPPAAARERRLHVAQADRAHLALDLRQDVGRAESLDHVVEDIVNRNRLARRLLHLPIDLIAAAHPRRCAGACTPAAISQPRDNRTHASGPPGARSCRGHGRFRWRWKIRETMRGTVGPRRGSRPRCASPVSMASGRAEHGAVVDEGVELAVFAAGVDRVRQCAQQRGIELAAGEGGVERARIDAGEARAQPPSIMSRASCAVGSSHSGKSGREAGAGELPFAIRADVLQEEIAEGDGVEALGHGAAAGLAPCALRTRRWCRARAGAPATAAVPRAAACSSSSVRRTPCMATRSAASLSVVSRAETRTCPGGAASEASRR